MHKIQEKILKLAENRNLAGLTLRKIGEMIEEPDSPQKIKHHLNKLMEKGLLVSSVDGKKISRLSPGVDKETNLVSLPIYGSANCGQALEFADDNIEGYLKVSQKILEPTLRKRIKDLFVLRAKGNSMNKANIHGKGIDDGDYVIVDKSQKYPHNGDYVVSFINGAANIKKISIDNSQKQVILLSESTSAVEATPIYIHEQDVSDYFICGKVVEVMKQPNELKSWEEAAAIDSLKTLGRIPQSEYNYYMNL